MKPKNEPALKQPKVKSGTFKPNDPRLIGNKYGKNGGAPRTVSPPKEDCIALGKEMVAWVEANKPTHLSEWFSIEKMITWKQWNAMCELPEFLPFYEIALNMVARNARNGTLDKSIAQRFLALYHRDLRKYDHEELKIAADLKKEESQTFNPEDIARMKVFMESIAKLQK